MLSHYSAPLSVYLNVTNECNLRCIYCSADSGTPYSNELSLEEIYGVIDSLREAKVFHVTVTGGEPFVRKDIFLILEKLVQSRIKVGIISNGTIVTDEIVRRLVSLKIDEMRVSLDATSPEANDAARGHAAFRRAYRGVKVLLDHGIRPTILVTVNKFNYDQVETIVEDLKKLDVQHVAFNLVSAVGRGVCTYPVLNLSQEQLNEFADLIRVVKAEHKGFVKEDFLHWFALPKRLDDYMRKQGDGASQVQKKMLPCGAAKTQCAITADGYVVPCNKFTDYHCGNLRENSFLNIWNDTQMGKIRALAQESTTDAHGCNECRYSPVCSGGCRAEAFLHYGDIEAPDPGCSVLSDSAVHLYNRGPALVQLTSTVRKAAV